MVEDEDVQKDGDDDVDVAEEEVEADDVQNDKFLRRKMMMLIGTYRDTHFPRAYAVDMQVDLDTSQDPSDPRI